MAIPVSALQAVAPSAIIELFELELITAIHGVNTIYRFHAGTNATGANGNVVWAGNTYQAFPIEAEGFEYTGNGQLPRPKIRVSNILGTITAIMLATPLEGAKVTRIRTMARYLDAVNFPARRNLYVYTENYLAAGWAEAGITWAANAALAPNGTMTASKMQNTLVTSGSHVFYRDYTTATLDTFTYSIYAKAAERNFVRLLFVNTGAFLGTSYAAGFNLATGTIDQINGGPFTAAITDAGNGWFRCSLTATTVATGIVRGAFYSAASATNNSYIENIGWGPYAWGAQLEFATEPSEYQPITGAAFTGNPYGTPDPTAEFPSEIYYIDRKAAENRDLVEFELASAFDLIGVRAPKRQCISNICQWVYRSAECSYTGTNYFTENDIATTVANDVCGKRVSSCKVRFGATAQLPFGSFPGVGTYFT